MWVHSWSETQSLLDTEGPRPLLASMLLFLFAVLASTARCCAFAICSGKLMFRPMSCLGRPLTADFGLWCNLIFSSLPVKVLTWGVRPKGLVPCVFRLLMKMG